MSEARLSRQSDQQPHKHILKRRDQQSSCCTAHVTTCYRLMWVYSSCIFSTDWIRRFYLMPKPCARPRVLPLLALMYGWALYSTQELILGQVYQQHARECEWSKLRVFVPVCFCECLKLELWLKGSILWLKRSQNAQQEGPVYTKMSDVLGASILTCTRSDLWVLPKVI